MAKPWVAGVVGLFSLATLPLSGFAEEAVPDREQASRELARQLGTSLQATLKTALQAGGPVNALNACHTAAPEIGATLSKQGVRVGRTALRVRNPNNAPSAEQLSVLENFSAAMARGTPPSGLEHFVEHTDGSALYMKAIPMQQAPCMACHGTHIDAALAERIKVLYPQDQAIGFAADDLRGAFVISWPPTTHQP